MNFNQIWYRDALAKACETCCMKYPGRKGEGLLLSNCRNLRARNARDLWYCTGQSLHRQAKLGASPEILHGFQPKAWRCLGPRPFEFVYMKCPSPVERAWLAGPYVTENSKIL